MLAAAASGDATRVMEILQDPTRGDVKAEAHTAAVCAQLMGHDEVAALLGQHGWAVLAKEDMFQGPGGRRCFWNGIPGQRGGLAILSKQQQHFSDFAPVEARSETTDETATTTASQVSQHRAATAARERKRMTLALRRTGRAQRYHTTEPATRAHAFYSRRGVGQTRAGKPSLNASDLGIMPATVEEVSDEDDEAWTAAADELEQAYAPPRSELLLRATLDLCALQRALEARDLHATLAKADAAVVDDDYDDVQLQAALVASVSEAAAAAADVSEWQLVRRPASPSAASTSSSFLAVGHEDGLADSNPCGYAEDSDTTDHEHDDAWSVASSAELVTAPLSIPGTVACPTFLASRAPSAEVADVDASADPCTRPSAAAVAAAAWSAFRRGAVTPTPPVSEVAADATTESGEVSEPTQDIMCEEQMPLPSSALQYMPSCSQKRGMCASHDNGEANVDLAEDSGMKGDASWRGRGKHSRGKSWQAQSWQARQQRQIAERRHRRAPRA